MSDYVANCEKYGGIYECPKGHLYTNFKDAEAFHCNACDDVRSARMEALKEAKKIINETTQYPETENPVTYILRIIGVLAKLIEPERGKP